MRMRKRMNRIELEGSEKTYLAIKIGDNYLADISTNNVGLTSSYQNAMRFPYTDKTISEYIFDGLVEELRLLKEFVDMDIHIVQHRKSYSHTEVPVEIEGRRFVTTDNEEEFIGIEDGISEEYISFLENEIKGNYINEENNPS